MSHHKGAYRWKPDCDASFWCAMLSRWASCIKQAVRDTRVVPKPAPKKNGSKLRTGQGDFPAGQDICRITRPEPDH